MSDIQKMSFTTAAKSHQLAMLYVEKKFKEVEPSVDELVSEYEKAVKIINKRLKGDFPNFV